MIAHSHLDIYKHSPRGIGYKETHPFIRRESQRVLIGRIVWRGRS